jgi:hypothetical protein
MDRYIQKKPAVEEKLEPPTNPSNPMGPRPSGPSPDSGSFDEYGTEGSSTDGGRTSFGTGPDHSGSGRERSVSDAVNFRRGMFALMSSFDWDKGQFSEHSDDVALKNTAMDLLGLPPHLSSQFNKDRMEQFLGTLKQQHKKREDVAMNKEDAEQVRRDTDYVRNLIKLSQTRFGKQK